MNDEKNEKNHIKEDKKNKEIDKDIKSNETKEIKPNETKDLKPNETKNKLKNQTDISISNEKLIYSTIIKFIDNDIQENINLPFYNKKIDTDQEKIIEIFKYNSILSKLKNFSQNLLLNINKKNAIQVLINNNVYQSVRQEIYDFTKGFFIKTLYYKNLLLIETKYKKTVLPKYKVSNFFGFMIKLLKYIEFLIKENVLFKLKRSSLNKFISKVIFYNSLIILYL